MEQFLGLSRDASREKSEAGTGPYNRNIVFDKQLGSITQENGFVFQNNIRGLVIGVYSTNTHIVYISYLTHNNKTLISYVNTSTNVVIEVLETIYFKYSVERPIEIIAWYNYNQDLLIMFSDGVFEKSSAPRIINLMDIGVELTPAKEFLNQRAADSTLLFSIITQPRFSIKYGNKANHDVDLAFFTISYILPDGVTRTKFISSLVEGFPLYAFGSEYKKELIFKVEDLDPFFEQFVIGIVVFRDNALFGYTTDPISYSTTTYEYVFNSIVGLNSVAVEEIVIESSIFDKVKSLTIGNDTVIVAGVITKTSKSYQKYAMNLKLNLYFDDRKDGRHQAPLLCPDEVYYFTIALAFNNGTYSEEFHIPNRKGNVDDVAFIDKTAYGLDTLVETNISKFKVVNTGDWDDASVGLPDFTVPAQTKLNWGIWLNEETYPNNENYNGAVDYDNNTPLVNGFDRRGDRVSLHRVPGLDNLCKKFPMRLGIDIKNPKDTDVDFHNRLPAFSIEVDNFLEAFGSIIDKDNIIGYRLSFVKKDGNSKIVEDINFIKPLVTNTEMTVINDSAINLEYTVDDFDNYQKNNKSGGPFPKNTTEYIELESVRPSKYSQFGFSRVLSINLSLYKGGTTSKIIKANYGLFNTKRNFKDLLITDNLIELDLQYRKLEEDSETKGTLAEYNTTILPNIVSPVKESLLFKLPNDKQKYAVVQSIEQVAGNIKSDNTLFIHEQIKLKAINSKVVYPNNITPTPEYGWNPLDYNPINLGDKTTGVSLPFYYPNTRRYISYTTTGADIKRINLSTTLINLKQNIHEGLQPKDFVIVGITNIANPKLVFKDFGDTFTNNIFNQIKELFYKRSFEDPGGNDIPLHRVVYFQEIYSGLIGIDNNTLISFVKDKKLGKNYILNENTTDVSELLTFNYIKQQVNKPSTRQLNSLIANVAFNRNKKYINKFPFRLAKSLTIQSENLSTLNVRTFLANAYYDMPSMRGEIMYVIGFDKGVYCQQRYSLSIFQLKEKLSNNEDNTAYLAESDLFAYKPQTLSDEDNKGYIGSVHQFAKKLSKNGLITVDAERGKIYLIGGDTPTDLSKIKMSTFFREILDATLNNIVPNMFNATAASDNPYNGNGIIFGVDDRTNRILITINNYTPLTVLPEDVSFINGMPYKDNKVLDIKNNNYTENKSNTLSFNLDWKRWVAEHDYYPQFYVNTNRRNYAGINSIKEQGGNIIEEKALVYITNEDKAKTGKYFYDFDNKIHESYIDLLFNSRYDLSKWYKSVMWRSTVKDINDNNIEEATINAILLYTDYQCSGRIELDTDVVSLIRNSEGLWSFNSFRDLAKNGNDLPIRKDGSFDEQKIYLNRNWFDKSDIISNFIIVRLIMNNIEDTQIHIHNVNTEARISDRI